MAVGGPHRLELRSWLYGYRLRGRLPGRPRSGGQSGGHRRSLRLRPLGRAARSVHEEGRQTHPGRDEVCPLPLAVGSRCSVERLGLERVDLYQIHLHLPPRSVEFWAEDLAEAVKAGLTRAVGVSNYNKNQMQRTYTVLTKYNIPLASNQVEYHLLNRSIEKNGLLGRCNELGVRLIAYSPLAKGLLTGKYTPGNPPPGFRSRGASGTLGRIQPLMQLLKEIGQAQGGKTTGQVALNWIICKGALPIPGAKNAKQAVENFGALGWHLTPDQVTALDEASEPFT